MLCTRPAWARGWCGKHYQRWRNHGDPEFSGPSEEDRFWVRVEKTDYCWLWTGGRNWYGYGIFYLGDSRTVRAHRYSYERVWGSIPHDTELDHRCRNTLCVNPDHLRLSSHKQNMENVGPRVGSASGVRGVHWDGYTGRWKAVVQHHGRQMNLGRFATPDEAEVVVIAKRNELFTHNDQDRQRV